MKVYLFNPENKGWFATQIYSLSLFLFTLLFQPATLHAVTYPFPETKPLHVNEEAVMKIGTKVYLFHSGTDLVRNTINVNDVLSVYREYPPDISVVQKEVGKVKVISPLGDYYFNGEVIGGEVKAGDVAKKGTVACFIITCRKNSHL